MSDEEVLDRNRRHFLTVATAVTGGVGVAMAAVPFLASLKPSARAQALGAPVEVPLGALEPGEMVRVVWRGPARVCAAPGRGHAGQPVENLRPPARPEFRGG